MKNKFIFWKPIKIKPFLNLGIYPKRSERETRLIDTNPWGDTDKDGVPNWFDCKPLNKRKQSKMLREEIRRRLNLPPESTEKRQRKRTHEEIAKIIKETREKYGPKERKKMGYVRNYPLFKKTYKVMTSEDIVRFLEKHPHLIKTAEKVRWGRIAGPSSLLNPAIEGETITDIKKRKGRYIVKVEGISLPSAYKRRKLNVREAIAHELGHVEQGSYAAEELIKKGGTEKLAGKKAAWRKRLREQDAEKRAKRMLKERHNQEKPEVLAYSKINPEGSDE